MELFDTSGALYEVPLDGDEGSDRPHARCGHTVEFDSPATFFATATATANCSRERMCLPYSSFLSSFFPQCSSVAALRSSVNPR